MKLDYGKQLEGAIRHELSEIAKQKRLKVPDLESALGHRSGWWRNLRRAAHGLSVADFGNACRWLKQRPEDVLKRLTAEMPSISDLPTPSLRKPPIVAAVEIALAKQQDSRCDEFAVSSWLVRFEELEDLRDSKPLDVLSQASKSVWDLPKCLLSNALAVAGSCYRILYAHEEALACLLRAREVACNRKQEGEALQRLVYVYKLEPRKAIAIALEAQELFCRIGEVGKIGESLVDLGFAFFVAANFDEALSALSDAAHYSAHLKPRYRFARDEIIALCYYKIDQTGKALEHLGAAELEAASVGDNALIMGNVLWARGLITKNDECLEKAISSFGYSHLFDASTCALDLCNLYIERKRVDKAIACAQQLIAFCERSGRNLAVSRLFENVISLLHLNRSVEFVDLKTALNTSRERQNRSRLEKAGHLKAKEAYPQAMAQEIPPGS